MTLNGAAVLGQFEGELHSTPVGTKLQDANQLQEKLTNGVVVEKSVEDQELSISEATYEIDITDFSKLKKSDSKHVSDPHFTSGCHKYCLIFRPNGLKYTKWHGKVVGIWLQPLPTDKDKTLSWPAKPLLSLAVKGTGLKIPFQEVTWERCQTQARYPVFNFDLGYFDHDKIGDKESVTIIVSEVLKAL